MKNMKTSLKLGVAFAVVVILSLAIGIVGIYGINQMDSVSSIMYHDKAKPLGNLTTATEYFQRLRVQTRNAVLYVGDAAQLKTIESDINTQTKKFRESLEEYQPSIVTEEGKRLYQDIMNQYDKTFEPGVQTALTSAKRGDPQEAILAEMSTASGAAAIIADDLTKLIEARMEIMSEANDNSTQRGNTLLTFIIVIIIVAAVISIVLSVYISGLISRPAVFMREVLYRMGMKGTVKFSAEEYRQAGVFAECKDEIGESIKMLINTGRRLESVGEVLETIASGDLTVEAKVLSEEDTIGTSLNKMLDNLNRMFGEINTAASQVSTAAKQISDGAQSLAQGTTEQAASTQQLSSSISQVATQTKENSEMANSASDLANTIRGNAQTGSEQMDRMTQAVKEINEASQSIGKIIKVIDDIAFQTNILALNAAVEAARAGQHGKGFAVVAEEVRNLAAKSAEAAKSTSEIIETSVQKAEMGVKIAGETAVSLSDIVEGINASSKIVADIAESSEVQSASIAQINTGITQVAQVVQTNSATAEQSAAASEQMRGQSDMLQNLVSQFKIKGASTAYASGYAPTSTPAPTQIVIPEKSSYSSNSYDKY